MTKTIALLTLCLIIIGCNSSIDKTNKSAHPQIEKGIQTKHIKMPSSCIGFWVLEDYIEALKQTKSTKKAGETGFDDFYRISADNSVMNLSLHEGGAENILLMNSLSEGQIFSSDTTEAYFKVEFNGKCLIINSKKYIKTSKEEDGFKEFVNKTLFSGVYNLNNRTIHLKDNGQIVGLDSIVNYEVNLDYADAGMQCDIIYLQFKNEKERRTYLYEFVSNALVIFNVNCLTKDDVSSDCVEVEKGTEYMRLEKK